MNKDRLQEIWQHLDDACGSLDNALIALEDWDEIPKEVERRLEYISFLSIVMLKNSIENAMHKIR